MNVTQTPLAETPVPTARKRDSQAMHKGSVHRAPCPPGAHSLGDRVKGSVDLAACATGADCLGDGLGGPALDSADSAAARHQVVRQGLFQLTLVTSRVVGDALSLQLLASGLCHLGQVSVGRLPKGPVQYVVAALMSAAWTRAGLACKQCSQDLWELLCLQALGLDSDCAVHRRHICEMTALLLMSIGADAD